MQQLSKQEDKSSDNKSFGHDNIFERHITNRYTVACAHIHAETQEYVVLHSFSIKVEPQELVELGLFESEPIFSSDLKQMVG